MKNSVTKKKAIMISFLFMGLLILGAFGFWKYKAEKTKIASPQSTQASPTDPGLILRHKKGDTTKGKEVFRFETFGNEGFWTDALRLPQGMKERKITTRDLLDLGLHVDIERVEDNLRRTFEKEATTDLSPKEAPSLNDPKVAMNLIHSNAVIGVIPKGDKVGVSCTICHAITDESVLAIPGKGTIGKRIDGPATLSLDVGRILATAANSRAYYPNLQARFLGVTIGRSNLGLGPNSTEEDFDKFLSDPKIYPVGTFDETFDGNGNSVKNVPLFRQDLAGPYGSAGEFEKLEDISNASYTSNLDLTTLVTKEGKDFLEQKAGPAGKQLAKEYEEILEETKVKGHPFVIAKVVGNPGKPETLIGRRVDEQKLLDMNAYLIELPAPKGKVITRIVKERGMKLFQTNCTQCHNADQSIPVPTKLIPIAAVWPGYKPVPVGLRGDKKLSPILNSPFNGFDDKMIVVDASDRGEIRGFAMPLLLDLERTNLFLHDASVKSLDQLLDPKRGKTAPHPFYFEDKAQRNDVVELLKNFDTDAANL